jgi:hypothetical protein
MRTAGWRIGGARVSAEWIWCQRLVDRSAVLLFPQGAYWYVYRSPPRLGASWVLVSREGEAHNCQYLGIANFL